jgi:type IV secretion system protein VirD4
MEALERKLAARMLVDFVRPEKVKTEAPVEPEPKLAAEIVAREEVVPKVELATVDAEVLVTVEQVEAIAEPEVDLGALRPPITIAVSRISKFSHNLAGLEL